MLTSKISLQRIGGDFSCTGPLIFRVVFISNKSFVPPGPTVNGINYLSPI